jgi:Zn-dependent protease
MNRLLQIFVVLVAVLAKSTKIIAALKLLKFGKPLVTLVSILISILAYGWYLGPWFGFGLVVMIFIHEMGHIVALRMRGFETNGPVFIPFLGAAIFLPPLKDRNDEAFVALGGPVLGTLGAFAALVGWALTEGKTSEIFLLVSFVGMFLNLFNLIPISPLDGGRIMQAVHPHIKYVGGCLVVAYTVLAAEPGLLLMWILVLDAFDRAPLYLRPTIGGILIIAMAGLMLFGFGKQPLWLNIADVMLGTFIVASMHMRDQLRDKKNEGPEIDDRPYPSNNMRMIWITSFLAMACITSAALVFQTQYLPKAIQERAESMHAVQ